MGALRIIRAWGNRFHVTVGELEVPFIGINEFVAIKRLAGRVVDLQDVDRLIEMGLYEEP